MDLDTRIYNDCGGKILEDSTYKGWHYRINSIRGSHPCCYIEIPKNHPWYAKDYNEIQGDFTYDEETDGLIEILPIDPVIVYPHGLFTYSDNFDVRGEWWVGWDYAHAGDFMYSYFHTTPYEYEHAYTIDELRKDVYEVIDQLDDSSKQNS